MEFIKMTNINKKADHTTAVGVLQIFLGSSLILISWIIALIVRFWNFFINGSSSWSVFMTMICIFIGSILIWRGFRNYKLASRFRRVSRIIGEETYIELSALEKKLDWNRRKLLIALNRQIAEGYWPDTYLDSDKGILIKGYSPTNLKTDSGIAAVDDVLRKANSFLHDMETTNRSIDDKDLNVQVNKLIDITKQIYAYVEKEPEKFGQVRKLTSYFLPTTVNLLNDYLELQNQAVVTENMQDSMKKIKDMTATIEASLEKRLTALYDSKAMAVSVEIDVMTQMMDL
jgi:5-bromo-4-chloroindolyl phosphate hydrolysis protein